MKNEKYVAYVGTYTHGTSVGIHIYDMDVMDGSMKERKVVPINNPSHLTVSNDGRYLYSIADEGVESFRILPDGDLEFMNQQPIGGMRGCYVDVDSQNRVLFVAGYHDGRISMLPLLEDGSIGPVAAGIFHQGMGRSVVVRSSRPHVNCVKITPIKEQFICAVDGALDQVKVYRINYEKGEFKLEDILRAQLDSAPRLITFSKNGRFAYLLCELRNCVDVYSYECRADGPKFEYIQSVPTMEDTRVENGSASGMEISPDGKYMFCSNAGANSVSIFEIDQSTGELRTLCCSNISGYYPKTIGIFPDGKYFVSLNHDSNQITTYEMNYEKSCFLMKGKPIKIETPNCIHIHKL